MQPGSSHAAPDAPHSVRNFLSLAAAETASKLLTFAAFAYLARVAGPDGFGYVEFAGAALLCASLVVDQGFGPYGAREIAKAPQRTASLAAEIVAARLVLAVAAYAALVAFALLLDRPVIVTRLLLLYGLSLFAMPWLLQWVFQGHDRMQTVAAAQVIRQTVFSALVFGLVHNAAQIWLVAVAEVTAVCSAAAYTMVRYRRDFGAAIGIRLAWSPHLLREGIPIGLSQMFWVVRMSGATLLLGVVASAQDVGFFAGASRVLLAAHTFVWLYYFNLLPTWARTWQRGEAAFAAAIEHSLHGVAWTALTVGLLWVLMAPAVMTTVYGHAFVAAGATLQWLAGVCVVAALSGHYRFGLIAAGRQTAEMASTAVGALVAAIAVPTGYAAAGVAGAAMGLLIAEVAVWLITWWCGRRMLGLNGHARLLLGPLLTVAVAAGCLSILPPSSLTLRMLVVLLLSAVAAVVLDETVRHRFVHGASVLRRQAVERVGTGVTVIWRR
jgi:O-antigen/teichoic acid export membrane protein